VLLLANRFRVSEVSLYLLEVSICSFSKAESEIKTTLSEAVGSYKAFSKLVHKVCLYTDFQESLEKTHGRAYRAFGQLLKTTVQQED
jgi:hypothetical protein